LTSHILSIYFRSVNREVFFCPERYTSVDFSTRSILFLLVRWCPFFLFLVCFMVFLPQKTRTVSTPPGFVFFYYPDAPLTHHLFLRPDSFSVVSSLHLPEFGLLYSWLNDYVILTIASVHPSCCLSLSVCCSFPPFFRLFFGFSFTP